MLECSQLIFRGDAKALKVQCETSPPEVCAEETLSSGSLDRRMIEQKVNSFVQSIMDRLIERRPGSCDAALRP